MKLIPESAAAVVLALCALVLMPSPASALEIRSSEEGTLRIEANETIDDTLMAFGQTVEIDGTVLGDLVVFGQTVVIRGNVAGNLITGAQTVTISGDVEGTVIGAGQTVNVTSAQIGRNLFGFSNIINASESTRIDQNAVVFSGQAANMVGPVGRDLYSFGTQLEVGNSVGGDLRVFGPNVSVLGPARIAGDLVLNGTNESGVMVSPDALIFGERIVNLPVNQELRNKYASSGWYVSQLLRFLAAFITGFAILALVPGLRNVGITGVGNGFASAGIGLVALVATPIIAFLAMFTVIGIPLALLSVMLYLVALYLAKIVVAFFAARKIFESRGTSRHYALTLAVGLALLIVVINLPIIGGLLSFVFTLAGLGLIVMFLFGQVKRLAGAKEAEA